MTTEQFLEKITFDDIETFARLAGFAIEERQYGYQVDVDRWVETERKWVVIIENREYLHDSKASAEDIALDFLVCRYGEDLPQKVFEQDAVLAEKLLGAEEAKKYE